MNCIGNIFYGKYLCCTMAGVSTENNASTGFWIETGICLVGTGLCGAVGWGTVLQTGRSRVRFPKPSGRTMALGLTQPLTEMSSRNISWGGKDGQCVGLTTLPPSCAVLKSGSLKLLEPSGPVQAYNGTALPFLSLSLSLPHQHCHGWQPNCS